MYTDIVGFTALTQKDESSTLQALESHRSLLRPLFSSHGGREIKTTGDGFLVEFGSALDATLCAIAVQSAMNDRRLSLGENLAVRIGVHVGDVIHKENDVFGDAVNIASRIEPLAEPGGVCVSEHVYDQVKNKVPFPLISIGVKQLKNVLEPVDVYKVDLPWAQTAPADVAAYPPNRIAILPFRNMSPDPNDEFFAEGITEEIISTVSGIGGLGVISRTSVMRYKGSNKSIEEIGKELKVGSVLEGSLRKAGSRIRVTTQLIKVADDEHLWAQNYDRNLDDVFEVQSDIAKQVADALRVRILTNEAERVERRPTESTTAYTLYLKGRTIWNKRGLEDMKEAIEYFNLAVHEDPGFALGYAGLADCYLLLRTNWAIDRVANLDKTKSMLTKAVGLDPELAEAHATKGLASVSECHLRQAEEEYRRAIELKPSYAFARMWYFQLLDHQQRWDEAREQIEKAGELDPLSPVVTMNLGNAHYDRREYRKALESYKGSAELDPAYYFAHYGMFWAYGRMKMFDEMRKEGDICVRLVKDTYPHMQAWADYYGALLEDDKEKVRRILPELEAYDKDPGWSPYPIAGGYIHLGENDKGFELLELAYSRWKEALLNIRNDFSFDPVRSDSRYVDLLKRLGLD